MYLPRTLISLVLLTSVIITGCKSSTDTDLEGLFTLKLTGSVAEDLYGTAVFEVINNPFTNEDVFYIKLQQSGTDEDTDIGLLISGGNELPEVRIYNICDGSGSQAECFTASFSGFITGSVLVISEGLTNIQTSGDENITGIINYTGTIFRNGQPTEDTVNLNGVFNAIPGDVGISF